MQWIFTIYLFVSSLLWVSLEVMVKLSDYFWKPNSRFSNFCFNCLLRFYFVYCNNCGLNDIKGHGWCDCSLVTLRKPDMCFWPAKTRKKLEFLDMHTIHWLGAQILFGHFDGYSCLQFWYDIFFRCFSDFRLNFSRIAIWRKRLQLVSECGLTTFGLFLEFFVGLCFISSTSYLRRLNSAWIAQFLSFLDNILFFWELVRAVFWSVLSKCLYFLITRFRNTE